MLQRADCLGWVHFLMFLVKQQFKLSVFQNCCYRLVRTKAFLDVFALTCPVTTRAVEKGFYPKHHLVQKSLKTLNISETSSAENVIPRITKFKYLFLFLTFKKLAFFFSFFLHNLMFIWFFGGKFQGNPFWIFCPKSCQGKRCANFSKFSRQKSWYIEGAIFLDTFFIELKNM